MVMARSGRCSHRAVALPSFDNKMARAVPQAPLPMIPIDPMIIPSRMVNILMVASPDRHEAPSPLSSHPLVPTYPFTPFPKKPEGRSIGDGHDKSGPTPGGARYEQYTILPAQWYLLQLMILTLSWI